MQKKITSVLDMDIVNYQDFNELLVFELFIII
jgi:hypothetical protein